MALIEVLHFPDNRLRKKAAPVEIIEERSVGPTLGRDSVEKGVRAILMGGIAVLAFMAIYYLLAGLIADLALVLNILIITNSFPQRYMMKSLNKFLILSFFKLSFFFI